MAVAFRALSPQGDDEEFELAEGCADRRFAEAKVARGLGRGSIASAMSRDVTACPRDTRLRAAVPLVAGGLEAAPILIAAARYLAAHSPSAPSGRPDRPSPHARCRSDQRGRGFRYSLPGGALTPRKQAESAGTAADGSPPPLLRLRRSRAVVTPPDTSGSRSKLQA